MSEWALPLDAITDGLTYPQFRLLVKARHKRHLADMRWQLNIASLSIQSKEQAEAVSDMWESLQEMDDETENVGTPREGRTWRIDSRTPLLHEMTPETSPMLRDGRKLVSFRTVSESEEAS